MNVGLAINASLRKRTSRITLRHRWSNRPAALPCLWLARTNRLRSKCAGAGELFRHRLSRPAKAFTQKITLPNKGDKVSVTRHSQVRQGSCLVRDSPRHKD